MNSMDPASMMALSIEQLLDTMAIRINGPSAWQNKYEPCQIDIMLTDVPKTDEVDSVNSGWHVNFSNAVMTDHEIEYSDAANPNVDLTVWATHQQLVDIMDLDRKDFGDMTIKGDDRVW
jgi:alkyl sulfatase BDS1-like metallo-beta-lactamase superfamily hydrolase